MQFGLCKFGQLNAISSLGQAFYTVVAALPPNHTANQEIIAVLLIITVGGSGHSRDGVGRIHNKVWVKCVNTVCLTGTWSSVGEKP